MITSTTNPSFISDILVMDVDEPSATPETQLPAVDDAIADTMATGIPSIKQAQQNDHDAVALCIPVYRSGEIVSLVIFVGRTDSKLTGVMEIWQPIGQYDELNLTQGYFGALDRFQNVSSFVRFEKGSGLPGQVWRNQSFILHDNLPSHPGFLRAAGASAESLQVAIGIPVFGDEFIASALLISSDATPIARGYEVWRVAEDHFLLESSAYQRLEKSLELDLETTVPINGTLPAMAFKSGCAVISTDPEVVFSGRSVREEEPCKGLAIPFYEGDKLTNILTLLV